MSLGPGLVEDLAAELVDDPESRQALVSDPRGWCSRRLVDPADAEALAESIQRRTCDLPPAERRVALAACFALGAATRS